MKDASEARVLSNKGTPRSFCGPVARPLRGLCRSPKHSIVRLEEWLEHDEANEVSHPRSPFVLAVLEFAVGKRSWARYCVQYFSRAREADAVCSIPCDAHARLRRLDV